jgi:predicted NAD/FAD-dependent oxidoreductase
MHTVAVIGAGLCGATAAAALLRSGHHVSVFDKGRSVGGRMSSKRTEAGYLDMGAQYFTARSAAFQHQVRSWLDAGCIEVWNCSTASLTHEEGRSALHNSPDQQLRYVGTPSMQAPVKALLEGIPVVTNCLIHSLQRHEAGWTLLDESGNSHTGFSSVLLTTPPAQAEQLLARSALPGLFTAQDSLLEPCWAVAVRTRMKPRAEAVFCQHPKLRFISHQATKTGRNSCYVLHFNATFSRDHLEQPAEFWFEQAADIAHSVLGIDDVIEPVAAHRWLYASQHPELEPPGIIALPDENLWLGGDWSYGGRVENAWLAGMELAASVIHHGTRNSATT